MGSFCEGSVLDSLFSSWVSCGANAFDWYQASLLRDWRNFYWVLMNCCRSVCSVMSSKEVFSALG